MTTAIIESRLVKIEAGSRVEHDSGRTEFLLPCDDWDKAAFRWPNPIHEWRESHAIACNLKITGRTFQERNGKNFYVRVRFEWVGDGEPSTYSGGWLVVGWPGNLPYAD